MLDLNRLRVFRAVAAAGSINEAASHLGYTSSAVSQHVHALQRETGLVLVTRVGRGIEVTQAGRSLAETADELLSQAAVAEARIRDLREGRIGSLTVSYFDSAGHAWVPATIGAIHEAFPGLRLNLITNNDGPETGERTDLRIAVLLPDYVAGEGFRIEPLTEEPYVVAVPATHRLAGLDVVDFSELADERWIDETSRESTCRRILAQACASAGFQPVFVAQTPDHWTALRFVEAGLGIVVLPRLCVVEVPAGVRVLGLANPTPTRAIAAIIDQTCQVPEAIALGVRELRAQVAQTTQASLPLNRTHVARDADPAAVRLDRTASLR